MDQTTDLQICLCLTRFELSVNGSESNKHNIINLSKGSLMFFVLVLSITDFNYFLKNYLFFCFVFRFLCRNDPTLILSFDFVSVFWLD